MNPIPLNDLLKQEARRDPIAFSTSLRVHGPILPLAGFLGKERSWLVMNYDDAIAILKDPRFLKDSHTFSTSPEGEQQGKAQDQPKTLNSLLTNRKDLLVTDPPDHTRLRRLVSQAFTPRMIEQLRPRIQQVADELLNAVQERNLIELIADFAFPLPITIISEMLGIPVADSERFRTWSQTMTMGAAESEPEKALAAMEGFVEYIKILLAEKRTHPGNDLTSGLVQAEERGDCLSETELISTIFLLIVAGHETTVNLIGNGTLALLQHPEQMSLLRANPSLVPSAIEELLRYTAPVSMSSPRWAREDIPLHDQVIRKGEVVFVSLIGANTDPRWFPNPTVLNIERQNNHHLAFGKGIHSCLGAPLARLEGQIALDTLLRRLPHLKLASDPEQLTWTQDFILRGLTALPVTF